MDRVAIIRSMFAISGVGLEIGPSYNPLFPKAEGFNVETVDHASAAQLRAKYANEANVDCSRIEDVDYVWDGRPLADVIGRRGCYDYIAASHVIEHTPDLLGFLKECDSLLAPDGVLFLAVPDKRRCFDVFRPLSTTGAILQAHAEGRARHCAAVAFDHAAYFANLNGAAGWMENSKGSLAMNHELLFARSIYERSLKSKDYYDFHAWTFCPSSFRLIVKELNEIDALQLREIKFMTTPSIEFFVTLSRSGDGCPLAREALLYRAQEELVEFPAIEDVPVANPPGEQGTELDSQAAKIAAETPHVSRASAEIEAETVKQALRAAERRILALERSTSWRTTAPLRAVARMLRG